MENKKLKINQPVRLVKIKGLEDGVGAVIVKINDNNSYDVKISGAVYVKGLYRSNLEVII